MTEEPIKNDITSYSRHKNDLSSNASKTEPEKSRGIKQSNQLVCNLCYKKDYSQISTKNPKYEPEVEKPSEFNVVISLKKEKNNLEIQNKINDRVKRRVKLTEVASTYAKKYSMKDKLIDKNLLENSFVSQLGNRNEHSYSKVIKNYLNKEYLQQNYLKKNVFNEKPVVKEFYSKYVEYCYKINEAITFLKTK